MLLGGEIRPDTAKVTFMLNYYQIVLKNIQLSQKNKE